jgi:hypothetical protein
MICCEIPFRIETANENRQQRAAAGEKEREQKCFDYGTARALSLSLVKYLNKKMN